MKKRDWVLIIVLLLSSLFATKALWGRGLFTSHDGPHQVVRLYYYEKALRDGQFLPRYILESLHGFGYPLFVFSYHLPWLMSVPFRFLGISIYGCLKLLFILTFSFSGLTMYFWQKKLWGRWGGFVSAFLYLWAPYRFVDIFVRASLGEAWCFVFLPLVFYGLQGQSLRSARTVLKQKILFGSLGVAGVILSHALIFVLLIPAIVIYWTLDLLNNFLSLRGAQATKQSPRNSEYKIASPSTKLGIAMTTLATFFFGFGLSAFYLLPAFFLKKFTIFEKIMAGVTSSFADHFLEFRQLLYSPWGYGFSFSGPNDGMSFQVGIAQWEVVGLTTVIILYVIARTLYRLVQGTKQSQKKRLPRFTPACRQAGRSLAMTERIFIDNGRFLLAFAFLLIFFFSIFMMLPISKPVWRLVNRFAYIDYPWRYLLVSVFAVSVLAGFVVWVTKNNKILIAVLLVLALYANRNHLRVNAWLDWSPKAFVGDGDTSSTFEEYTPLWADGQYIKQKRELVEILQGEGEWRLLSKKTNKVELAVKNERDSLYRVNLLYFPEVKILIDGKSSEYDYKEKGVLNFSISKGEHKVEVLFIRTVLEKMALVISLLSWGIFALILFRSIFLLWKSF